MNHEISWLVSRKGFLCYDIKSPWSLGSSNPQLSPGFTKIITTAGHQKRHVFCDQGYKASLSGVANNGTPERLQDIVLIALHQIDGTCFRFTRSEGGPPPTQWTGILIKGGVSHICAEWHWNIFTYVWLQFMVNVGIYNTSYMEYMGM